MNHLHLCKRIIRPIYHQVSAPLKRKPAFMIIGGAKCGTFALYYYLNQHTHVRMSLSKEPHYFNNSYCYGAAWYRYYFPWKWEARMTGEATADYFFHPRVASRVAKDFPHMKLIVLLRDPVERAFSHYRHNIKVKPWIEGPKQGVSEVLSFEEALEAEEDRIEGEKEKILNDENYYSWNYEHFSYKARGRYVESLIRWLECFDRNQLLLLKSEDLKKKKKKTYQRVLEFVDLPAQSLVDDQDYHITGGQALCPEKERGILDAYFQPYNDRLYEKTGIGWRD